MLAQNLLTFVLVVFGWVFFRADSMGDAFQILGAMVGFTNGSSAGIFVEWTPLQTIAMIAAPIVVWGFRTTQEHAASPKVWWMIAVFSLFLVSLVHLHRAANVPFLSSGGDEEHPLLDFGDAREGPFFPSLKAASVQSAVPFGPRAGRPLRRLKDPDLARAFEAAGWSSLSVSPGLVAESSGIPGSIS